MNKLLISFWSLFFLVLLGCKHNQPNNLEVITVNEVSKDALQLSAIAKDVEMIKLETNDSCLLSYIADVKATPEYVFVSNYENVLQFDRNGHFIRKIGSRGKGPEEYPQVRSFACDTKNKILYIPSIGKILCFSFDGKHIRNIKTDIFIEYASVFDGQLWAFYRVFGKNTDAGMVNETHLLRFLKEGVVLDSMLTRTIKVKSLSGTTMPKAKYLSNANNQLFVYCPDFESNDGIPKDTLYLMGGKSMVPSVKVDFGSFKKNESKEERLTIINIHRTDCYLFATYVYKKIEHFFCYDFKNNMGWNMMDGVEDDINKTGKVILYPVNLDRNMMYFVKEGYELEGIIDGVDSYSNPVVFLVKLRG